MKPTTLYKLNNTGKVSWWTITPNSNDPSNPFYEVSWGQDHKQQSVENNYQRTSAKHKPSSLEDQVQSKINEMIARKGYSYDIPTSSPELPMLAQPWKDFRAAVDSDRSEVRDFELTYLQPKIDGIRCIATGYTMYSRRNDVIRSCPHIELLLQALHEVYGPFKLDGELYIEGADLQTISSAVKRGSYDPIMVHHIKYFVFDLVDLELTFKDRSAKLREIYANVPKAYELAVSRIDRTSIPKFLINRPIPFEFVPTYRSTTTGHPLFSQELKEYHEAFVQKGFEGTIIRNGESLYQPNYRTFDLVKYKDFMDSEFPVVDVLKDKDDCAIFLCKTEEGKHFKVTPSFRKTRRQQIYLNKENYIGQNLTVSYEKFSKDGVPLKPIGKAIRQPL